MTTIRIDPTFRDIAEAARFMAQRDGSAKDAEQLAWLIAFTRHQEREACARIAEECVEPTRPSDSLTEYERGRRQAAQRIRHVPPNEGTGETDE